MANHRITPEVEKVLRRSTIDANILFLPPGQLDRKLYESVNAVLANAGGKWNRTKKGHVFSSDPMTKLGIALATGKSIDEQQVFQSFYTPAPLANRMAILASVTGHVVLEPSAGMGALADACMAQGARKVQCVDINPSCIPVLKGKGYEVHERDFLFGNIPGTLFKPCWTLIVMNPPFTRGADLKHLAKALQHLTPTGILVCLVAGNRDVDDIRALAPAMGIYTEKVPAKTFDDTPIETMIVQISP